jgi:hypothetical protein
VAKAIPDVLPGCEVVELTYGTRQERFPPMPAVRLNEDGDYLTRHRLSEEELRRVAETGEVYVVIHTRSGERKRTLMTPVTVFAEPPAVVDGQPDWPEKY